MTEQSPQVSGLSCAFRRDVRDEEGSESAVCGFVQQLTRLDDEICRVDRSACEVCLEHSPFAPAQLNPVVPSLVLGACDQAANIPSGSTAAAMQTWAEATVRTQSLPCIVPAAIACDVVMVCSEHHDVQAAVDSVLSQENVFPVLHLVADGERFLKWIEPYATQPSVRIHCVPESRGTWACFQEIAPQLDTPWIAVQCPTTVSLPCRLKESITTLQQTRGEIFGAACAGRSGRLTSVLPNLSRPGRSLIASTLVMRRGTYVDAGGFDLSQPDPAEEFFLRSACEGAAFFVSDDVLVTGTSELPAADPLGTPAWLRGDDLTQLQANVAVAARPTSREDRTAVPRVPNRPRLTSFASGFPESAVHCDVVLPFRNDFDFVREAMHGLLNQQDAEIVIHLVDDASRAETASLMNQYRDCGNVRLYRNQHNIGPFATFNNISLFAETDFIAVQDADDISLPDRITKSVRTLEVSNGDLLGASTELFGHEDLVHNIASECRKLSSGSMQYLRRSRYPFQRGGGYFLENPTLTMRLETFRQLGGYADFGEGRRNRTGVDTELQARAHFSSAHIVVTRDVLVRYRCHGASATNHSASGFGSAAQLESHAEFRRRLTHYATGSFNPKWFGALGRHEGITRRL